MIPTAIIVVAFVVVAYYSEIDLLGMYLLLLVTQGIYVKLAGVEFQNMPSILGLFVIIAITYKRGSSYWKHKKLNPYVLLVFAALLVVMIVTGMTGINVEQSMFAMHLYMKGFVLAMLIYLFVNSRKDIRKLAMYYLAGALIGTAWIAWEFYSDSFSGGDEWTKRAAGLRADPNNTAMLLVVAVPITWYFGLEATKRVYQVLLFGCIPLIMWGMALTGSRGGLLALLLTLILIIMNKPTVKKSVAAILTLAVIVGTAPGVLLNRSDALVDEGEMKQDGSMRQRADLLVTGLKVIAREPILGVGPGNIGQAIVAYKFRGSPEASLPEYIFGKSFTVAHNMFVEFFGELGIVGGILFLRILYFSLHNYWRSNKLERKRGNTFSLAYALLVGMAGFLFAGLFLSQGKESVLWFLLGMGLAYPATSRTRRRRKKKLVAV